MQGEYARITDELIQQARETIGRPEKPLNNQFVTVANTDAITRFAHGIGDLNPLWLDEEYARKSRWGTIIAPPTFHRTTCFGNVFPRSNDPVVRERSASRGQGLPGLGALSAGDQMTFCSPVKLDDRLLGTRKVVGIVDSLGRQSGDLIATDTDPQRAFDGIAQERAAYDGRMIDSIQEFKTYRQPSGELLTRSIHHLIRFECTVAPEEGRYRDLAVARYTQDELDGIDEMYEREFIRGSDTLFWEDVAIGGEIPTIVRGPYTITGIMAFVAGTGSWFLLGDRVKHLFLRRYPGAGVRNLETNVLEVTESQHWEKYTSGRLGFPIGYDTGISRSMFFGTLLTNWIGDDGFLRQLNNFHYRPIFLYDTAYWHGRVVKKNDADSSIELDLWAENQRGESLSKGEAIVELPRRQASGAGTRKQPPA